MAAINRKPVPSTYVSLNQHSFHSPRNDDSSYSTEDLLNISRQRHQNDDPGACSTTMPQAADNLSTQPSESIHEELLTGQIRSQSSSRHKYRIFWYWKWEFVGIFFAFGLLAAMYSLLLCFNEQQVPDWGYSINLSTILALLATIFRAVLVMVVGQIISQAKWIWYSETRLRPLQNLQDFDYGSRSVLGSAFLIPKVLRSSFVTALAALVMIVSLAVGSFVQQAIQTTACPKPVPGTTASLPYAHYICRQGENSVDLAGGEVDLFVGEVDLAGGPQLELQNAVFASLIGGDSAIENQISPSCTTGNCTFPNGDPFENSTFKANTFSTMGMCSSCVEVSSLCTTNLTDYGYESTLPNGLNLSWLGDLLTPELAQVSRWAVANVTFLSYSSAQCGKTVTSQCPLNNGSSGPIAATCALYPCIRRISPSITNNKLSEQLIDTSMVWPVTYDSASTLDLAVDTPFLPYQNAASNLYFNYAGIQSPCRVDDTIYTEQNISTAPNASTLWIHETLLDGSVESKNVSAPEPCIYRQSSTFTSTLTEILTTISPAFGQICALLPIDSGVGCGLPVITGTDPYGSSVWMYNLYNKGNATISAIEEYFESFAVAMTNRYRTVFGSAIFNDSVTRDILLPLGEVQGIVWQDSICTSVKWEWLLLPTALAILTFCLLIWIVARNWRLRHVEPVWKDNILPALLYKERFRDDKDSVLSVPAIGISSDMEKETDRLLEIDEMDTFTKTTMVKFQWLKDLDKMD